MATHARDRAMPQYAAMRVIASVVAVALQSAPDDTVPIMFAYALTAAWFQADLVAELLFETVDAIRGKARHSCPAIPLKLSF